VTVPTPEEIEQQKIDAAKAATDALLADPNGAFAAARRQADAARKAAEDDATAKTTALAEAQAALAAKDGATADETAKLKQDIADALQAKQDAEKAKADTDAAYQRDLSLIGTHNVAPGSLTRVKVLLAADGVDLSNADAMGTALTSLRESAPGFFSDGKRGAPPPAGGAQNPPKHGAQPTAEELGAMSPSEYAAYRAGKS
jgi:hypothetical protein